MAGLALSIITPVLCELHASLDMQKSVTNPRITKVTAGLLGHPGRNCPAVKVSVTAQAENCDRI
jgi:hypothetical protein